MAVFDHLVSIPSSEHIISTDISSTNIIDADRSNLEKRIIFKSLSKLIDKSVDSVDSRIPHLIFNPSDMPEGINDADLILKFNLQYPQISNELALKFHNIGNCINSRDSVILSNDIVSNLFRFMRDHESVYYDFVLSKMNIMVSGAVTDISEYYSVANIIAYGAPMDSTQVYNFKSISNCILVCFQNINDTVIVKSPTIADIVISNMYTHAYTLIGTFSSNPYIMLPILGVSSSVVFSTLGYPIGNLLIDGSHAVRSIVVYQKPKTIFDLIFDYIKGWMNA